MLKRLINKKSGSVLVLSMFAGIFVLIVSLALLTTMNNEIKMRKAVEERVAAKYLAEAGIEEALYLFSSKTEAALLVMPELKDSAGKELTMIGSIGGYSIIYFGTGKFQAIGTTKGNKSIKIEVNIDNTGTITKWDEVPL